MEATDYILMLVKVENYHSSKDSKGSLFEMVSDRVGRLEILHG